MSNLNLQVASQVPVPKTRFGLIVNHDWTFDINYVDWDMVVLEEQHSVAQWVVLLHRSEHHAAKHLLKALISLTTPPTVCTNDERLAATTQWSAILKTELIPVLLDIVCEPDLFDVKARFKNKEYGEACLTALNNLLSLGADLGMWVPGQPLTNRIVFCAEQFIQITWERRGLVAHLHNDGTVHQGCDGMVVSSFQTVWLLAELYATHHHRVLPISSFAAHFFLYFWVYPGTYADAFSDRALVCLHAILMAKENANDLHSFATTVLTCQKSFAQHFHARLCEELRSPRIMDDTLRQVGNILLCFTHEGLHQLSPCIHPYDTSAGIVPSLVIACRRQMCCSDSEMDEFSTATFTQRALHSLAHLLKAEASRTAATAQYAQCLVDHNLVSILGQWMSRLPEHRTKDVHLNDIPLLLGAVYDGVGCDSSLYPIVKEKVQRVWDDTLNSLIRIRPGENQETKQRKKKAIESWRQFGDYFRVDEQLMVTTLQVPSELSNFAKYWKIPRRCFSSLCTCAAAGQQHPMRVCKGCYRALYCSRKCQRV